MQDRISAQEDRVSSMQHRIDTQEHRIAISEAKIAKLESRLGVIDARTILDAILICHRPETSPSEDKAEAFASPELDEVWDELKLSDNTIGSYLRKVFNSGGAAVHRTSFDEARSHLTYCKVDPDCELEPAVVDFVLKLVDLLQRKGHHCIEGSYREWTDASSRRIKRMTKEFSSNRRWRKVCEDEEEQAKTRAEMENLIVIARSKDSGEAK